MDNNDRVLLVEGQHDEHVISHLWCSLNSYEGKLPFQVKDKQGYSNLLDSIKSEINVSDRKAIGILVDADKDLNARWHAVTDRLKKENVEVPDQPDPVGTIIPETTRSPKIGIWLMPDSQSAGELENFVAEMIPEDDPVWPRSKSYIQSIPEEERKFAEKKILRAKVHAWLATREEPRKMGTAIRAGDLKTTGPLCTAFADWLRELFDPSP